MQSVRKCSTLRDDRVYLCINTVTMVNTLNLYLTFSVSVITISYAYCIGAASSSVIMKCSSTDLPRGSLWLCFSAGSWFYSLCFNETENSVSFAAFSIQMDLIYLNVLKVSFSIVKCDSTCDSTWDVEHKVSVSSLQFYAINFTL